MPLLLPEVSVSVRPVSSVLMLGMAPSFGSGGELQEQSYERVMKYIMVRKKVTVQISRMSDAHLHVDLKFSDLPNRDEAKELDP